MNDARVHATAATAIAEDAFLGAAFGYPAYRVDGSSDAALADVRRHGATVGRAFYHTKFPVDAVARLAEFTANGWRVVDVNVQFRVAPAAIRRITLPPDVTVRIGGPSDAAVADIAERCFRYSRFHLDPDIPARVANRIKRAWVENYLAGTRGDRLFVATVAGRTVGFLAAARCSLDGAETAVIELVGVDPACQHRGIGTALMLACADAYAECDALLVGTQAANVPSVSCYERLGFRFVGASYVIHRHHPQCG